MIKMGWAIAVSIMLHGTILALPMALPEYQPHYSRVLTLFLVDESPQPGSHKDVDDRDYVPAPTPISPTGSSPPPAPHGIFAPSLTPDSAPADPQPAHIRKQAPTPAVPPTQDVGPVAAAHGVERSDFSNTPLHPSAPGAPLDTTFGDVEGPRFARKVVPIYPRRARRMGREGFVLLRLTIDSDGQVVNIEPLEAEGKEFEEAAIKAVKESTFEPATKNGKPVACRAVLPFRFSITR